MRKLDRFTFHEGTADNPVVLSSTQIKTLINMISDENFVYDFSGYVTSENGIFTKGEYNQLTFGGFNVIYTTLSPDEFSVEPVNTEINEGESTKIITNGLISKLVKFEIGNVSVKNNVITNSEFKSKCSVDDNGVLHIAPAEENLDWEAEVNIIAYPSYSSKAEGRSCIVKVKAIKITDIFFDSSVPEIVDEIIPTTLAIKPYPNNNTKTYTVVFSAINGIIDGSFYSSNNNLEDTITATANVLGNTFIVSKDIIVDKVILNDSIKNPIVFASLKEAFNLGDDVHEFKISAANKITNDQVNNFLKILAKNNNTGTSNVTFNELRYFNCTEIDVGDRVSFKNLIEVTFPDNLLQLYRFFIDTRVTDWNFNNCKNKVKLGSDESTHMSFLLHSDYIAKVDLSNTSIVNWGSNGNGIGKTQKYISEFILGENTKFTGYNFWYVYDCSMNLQFEELHIPNIKYIKGSGKTMWDKNSLVKNVTIDKSYNIIPQGVFKNLSNLITINGFPKVSDDVTIIEQEAFYKCTSLSFNTLPQGLFSLKDKAFYGCISIPYMDLSSCRSLYSINNSFNANVFEECTNLAYIKLPSIGIVIPATNISSLPVQTNIYVPDNLVDSYKSATNWNSIASRIHGYSEM